MQFLIGASIAVVLAFGAGWLLGERSAWSDANATVARATADLEQAQAQVLTTAELWGEHAARLRGELRDCQGQWTAEQTASEVAVARAEAGRLAAEQRLSDFQRRYATRPDECTAALQHLDTVCASVGRY